MVLTEVPAGDGAYIVGIAAGFWEPDPVKAADQFAHDFDRIGVPKIIVRMAAFCIDGDLPAQRTDGVIANSFYAAVKGSNFSKQAAVIFQICRAPFGFPPFFTGIKSEQQGFLTGEKRLLSVSSDSSIREYRHTGRIVPCAGAADTVPFPPYRHFFQIRKYCVRVSHEEHGRTVRRAGIGGGTSGRRRPGSVRRKSERYEHISEPHPKRLSGRIPFSASPG